MSGYSCDLKKLADLLKTEETSESSDDDLPPAGLSKLGPGNLGDQSTATKSGCRIKIKSVVSGDSIHFEGEKTKEVYDKDAIWCQDEIIDGCMMGDEHFDPREQPEYDIKYQQAVSPEDVFLQMSGKTASTASCENMVIIIQMQGESKKAINLTVTKTTLEVRSPLYRLQLHLPHCVDPDKGHAKWDSSKQELQVALLMEREYDFINF